MSDRSFELASIDVGQSGVRIRFGTPDAPSTQWRTGEGLDALAASPLTELAARVRVACRGLHAHVVGVGVTGDHSDDALERFAFDVMGALGAREVRIAHDSVTAHLGAFSGDDGVVIAAGTGVVALGVSATSVVRLDGWGALLGDRGGGYWVGRAGLRSAVAAEDGFGPRTALTAAAIRRFGPLHSLRPTAGRPGTLATGPVAAFAKDVLDAATSDEVARRIAHAAAAALARTTVECARRTFGARARGITVSGVGGIFGSPLIRSEWGAHVRAADLVDRDPLGDPLDGAALLPVVLPGYLERTGSKCVVRECSRPCSGPGAR